MKTTFKILLFILFLFCIFFFLRTESTYDIGAVKICLLFVMCSVAIYLYGQQHSMYQGFWNKPSNILLLGLLILNFQYLIDLVFGLKTFSDFIRPNAVIYSCYLSTLGTLAYLVGASRPRIIKKQENFHSIIKIKIYPLIFLQIVFFVLWVMTVNVVTLLLGLQYGEEDETNLANFFEGLFCQSTMAILVCIALNCRSQKNVTFRQFISQNSFASWLCVGLYMIMRLVSGDRGPFIYTAFGIFFTFVFVSKFKLKLRYGLFALFIGALLVTLVGMARNDAASSSFSQRISNSSTDFFTSNTGRFSDGTILNSTEELAMSIRCNLIAVDEIEHKGHSLNYGKYQVYQILNIIPYMPSYLRKTLKIPLKELSSDAYLTLRYFGDYFSSGQIGTSCIADFYLDLGVFGVFFGMLVLGLLFNRIDWAICFDRYISPMLLITVLLFASRCVYISRSTVLGQIKPIIIVAVLFYLNLFLFNSKVVKTLRN